MKLSSKLIPRKFCCTTFLVGGDDGTEIWIGSAAETERMVGTIRAVKRATVLCIVRWNAVYIN